MAASGYGFAMMVNDAGIYGFCLFKKKNVGEADVSVYINMYGLKPVCSRVDVGVDVA